MNKQRLKKLGIDTSNLKPGGLKFNKNKITFDKTSCDIITINDVICFALCISKHFKEDIFYIKGQTTKSNTPCFAVNKVDINFSFISRKIRVSLHSQYGKIHVNFSKSSIRNHLSDEIFLFDSSIDRYNYAEMLLTEYEFSCKDLV